MTAKQLQTIASHWIDVLGLVEWEISIGWGSQKQMGDCDGLNHYSTEQLKSSILIYRKQSDVEIELTVVHELLHLIFDGHITLEELKYNALHERALNRTSEAFVKLAAK